MLETPESNRTNHQHAMIIAAVIAAVSVGASLLTPYALIGLALAYVAYGFWRRQTKRRLAVMDQPFPEVWETTLQENVAYFRALDEPGRERFRNMVKVFLDETRITGIRTDVDEPTRALVAASAVIPVFGFEDWEYSSLGEVLIYPNAFGDDYSTEGDHSQIERRTLGMVGVGHLNGVMILSKPDLWGGFRNPEDKRNVGIHEFAHLVDKADGSVDGVPAGISIETAGPWLQWVGHELKSRPDAKSHIDDYAYTNEAEYFAVLSEYFFEAPDILQKKDPKLYDMMKAMYHQNTQSFLSRVARRRKRVGRNADCPCGSGEKFKRCCMRRQT